MSNEEEINLENSVEEGNEEISGGAKENNINNNGDMEKKEQKDVDAQFKESILKSLSIKGILYPQTPGSRKALRTLSEPDNFYNNDSSEKNDITKPRNNTVANVSHKHNVQYLPSNYPSYDYLFKAILMGDDEVGKSSIILRSSKNEFSSEYKSTVGVLTNYKIIKIDDEVVKFQVLDISGKDNYQTLPPNLLKNLFKNISLAVLVYSVDKAQTFQNLANWFNLIRINANPETLMFLVGNKCDLEKREVSLEEGAALMNDYNFQYFTETSAKKGLNCDDIFKEAAVLLINSSEKIKDLSMQQGYFSLDEKLSGSKQGKCC